MTQIYLAAEDQLGLALGTKIIPAAPDHRVIAAKSFGGIGALESNRQKFIDMSRNGIHVIVIADLDFRPCPSDLVNHWFPDGLGDLTLSFRIAVREAESWLFGDRERLARFLHVSSNRLPAAPEEVADPKQLLLQLAKGSSSRSITKRLVPDTGSTARVGPEYNSTLLEFIDGAWRMDVARSRSPSLDKAIRRVEELLAVT